MIRILLGPWKNIFEREIRKSLKEICIVVPFISNEGVKTLLKSNINETNIRLITRLNEEDFMNKVSSIEGLLDLQRNGVKIRVQNKKLHSKLYFFDETSVIVTSSNMTRNGLSENTEVGVQITSTIEIQELKRYFERMWDSLGPNIDSEKLHKLHKNINKYDSQRIEYHRFQKDLIDHGKKGYVIPTDYNESNIKHWCKFVSVEDYRNGTDFGIESISDKQAVLDCHHRRHNVNLNNLDYI